MTRNNRDDGSALRAQLESFWTNFITDQMRRADVFLYSDGTRDSFPTPRPPVEDAGSTTFTVRHGDRQRRQQMRWTQEQIDENVRLYGNRWGLSEEAIEGLTLEDFHEGFREWPLGILQDTLRDNDPCSCSDRYCTLFRTGEVLNPYFERLEREQHEGEDMTDTAATATATATVGTTTPPRPPAPAPVELHISATLDWTRSEWCQNGGLARMKEWVLGQLRGEYPEWSSPFPVAIYINGEPTIVQGGYWEGRRRRDGQVFVGLFQPSSGSTRQFEIATTLAISGVFGLQGDEEIVAETERAIARMLSGIVTTLTTGLINTRGSVSAIAMNGSQLAARVDGVWRASNGSVVDVTGGEWVTFDYRQ